MLSKKDLKKMYEKYCCKHDETIMYDSFMVIEKAEGFLLWDRGDKKPYYDTIFGYSANNFGHCYPEILKSVQKHTARLDHFHSFNCPAKIELSKLLVDLVPGKPDMQVYFPIGGAASIETAVKYSRGFTGKKDIITFKGGFHGLTLTALMLNGKEYHKRDKYLPLPGKPIEVEYANCFRCKHKCDSCNLECTIELEQQLKKNKNVAGVLIEPIQGANGFIVPPAKFLKRVEELTRKSGAVFIADEVQMGIGRTGKMYSFEHFDIHPDMILLSKSLAGGYYPLGAVLCKSNIMNSIQIDGSGIGSTFGNSPLGTSIALDVINMCLRKKLFDNALKIGNYFTDKIKSFERFPFIAFSSGIGLAQSFEFVIDKKGYKPAPQLVKAFQNISLKKHLITYIGGIYKNRTKIALPIWITKKDADFFFNKFEECLEELNHTISQ
ncbi:aspartate aminotransferase family protein [Candidatus Dependentiae bacterium]|nr:aspartate aminotransferase family protein [Candidatus Dependentiae bacterium]